MADLARPEYGTPWASEGEIVAPTQDKVELGWVKEMMPFQWENYLQNRQDSAITYLLQKGIPEYSDTQEYIAQKSAVLYMGAVYIATQTVTGILPTVAASWKRISTVSDASGTVAVAGGGTGATTAEGARANLGLGTASLLSADVVVQKDASGNFSAGIITASLAGNATSADKWKTARTINIVGAATSDTKSVDGTANTTLTVSELDATKLVGVATVNTSGNAATATKLQTARTITLTGGASGVSNASDGSADFAINVTNLNASTLGSGTVPTSVLSNAVTKTSQTGSAVLPSGTTAERDTLPQESYFRYNKTTKLPEFYDGTSWKSLTGLNTGNFVSKTSQTGAGQLPEGDDSQRPDPSIALGGLLRVNTSNPPDYLLEMWNRSADSWDTLASRTWATSKINELVSNDVGFTIIYPNGGTEAAPATANPNSRYVVTNPFPNHPVICVGEVLVNGIWADPGYISNLSNQGAGVKATQVNGVGDIVLQTSVSHVCTSSVLAGGGHGLVATNITSAPCRVKVWKAG